MLLSSYVQGPLLPLSLGYAGRRTHLPSLYFVADGAFYLDHTCGAAFAIGLVQEEQVQSCYVEILPALDNSYMVGLYVAWVLLTAPAVQNYLEFLLVSWWNYVP